MSKKIAFLFPGQGAQYVGMAKDFYENYAVARATFEEADELLKTSFSKIIFEGPADVLTLTKNSQLAIYIVSVAIWRTVAQEFPDLKPAFCAGLSLGEYTALTAAKKISFQEGLLLVQARAAFMNEACEKTQGTMQVVLGLEPEAVSKALASLEEVWIANLNCPGQVVIAGTPRGIASAQEPLKAAGAKRILPLDVSGAFHTALMKDVEHRLTPYIKAAPLQASGIEVITNVTGLPVATEEEIRSCLIKQVSSPVYWEKGIRHLVEQGVDLFLEMGCGKTLAGMNKRIGVTAPTISIEKLADLEVYATTT
ncbi:MAG TPA: ACP S-malonyltransferase [Rhabdochlamydiaceae bacterium]